MTPQWTEQVAIITGGGDGLGRALAQKLNSLGVRVALFDVNEEKMRAAQNELQNSLAVRVDVTDENAVREAVAQVFAKCGRVDILINCAGITGKTGIPSYQVETDDFERVLRINLLGCFLTSKAVLPGMLERDYGRILHIASIAGKEGNAGMVAYSASKAGVIGMTKSQAKDCATTGVTINALAPAVIRTEMVAAMPEHQVKYMTDKIPMQRCGTLDEVANLGAFIVSPESSFTTGFTWDISGGRATY